MQEKIISPLLQRLTVLNTKYSFSNYMTSNTELSKWLYEEIRKNIEAILNSRKHYHNLTDGYTLLKQSLINYGLNDFMLENFSNPSMSIKFCRNLEELIKNFEPRVVKVAVNLPEAPDEYSRIIKLRITAQLKVRYDNQIAVFESSYDGNKRFVVM